MRRTPWWAAAALAAVAGCSGPAGPNPNETNMLKGEGTTPAGAAASAEPAKGGGGGGGGPGATTAYPSNYPAPVGAKPDAAKGQEKEQDKDKDKEAKPADEAKPDAAKKEEGQAAAVTLTPDEIANIKKLPEADQAAALAQKVCLVNEEEGMNHLGAMGVPVKRVVKGRTVFLCCKSCIKDLETDPDKYLAKLDKLTGKK